MPEMYIPYMINNNIFVSMADLKSYNAYIDGRVYVIGYVLIEYITDEYGNDKLIQLFKQSEDYLSVFGKSEEAFYADWLAWLKQKYCK